MPVCTTSLSGYTKKFVNSQLCKALCTGDYDSSCYWSVEMHISGWIDTWWTCIVHFCALNIHISNPKIGKFLYKIITDYISIKLRLSGRVAFVIFELEKIRWIII